MNVIGAWGRRIGGGLTRHAGACLAVSLAAHVLAVVTHPTEPLDLTVYRGAAPHVLSGGLYDFAVHTGPPIPLLPFTYPPFAALVFLPLSWVPGPTAIALWQAVSVAALVVVARCALRLLRPRPDGRDRALALLWAAAGLWLEPVRHTLDQGQVNLVLGAVVLAGLALPRGALVRGAAVGLAAAVKLTPAVAGLYLLATRQWRAAAWAVATAAAATAAAWCVAPDASVRYWTVLVTQTRRVGPLWSVRNQSLRGALARLAGHDGATATALWWAALVLVTAATGWAVGAAVRRGDRLGILVAVELYGLLVSPVSWSHHWIWCVPAMIWLAHGPHRRRPVALAAFAAWAAATGARLVPLLIRAEDGLPHPDPYPAPLAWPGSVYAVCALLTFAALASGPVRDSAAAGDTAPPEDAEPAGDAAPPEDGTSAPGQERDARLPLPRDTG
ncbi:glycosyltransferase 87 family protein [Streptomyces tropicalis]|uniref:Glycosyltransferase 87 family protein n=1 Tax=Streptomyces tropicalis TaxID=3034234 RepID=A0ABT6A2W8_9ACTN|nr:glycosyltransferase 87 family protein [Streptomyces tropicalis]MDF3299004.1 glycosyltransferase 87 family protein [Streptomyces tropicalis]